jgi:RNA polymerase sigma factor (sigma-70 family)
VDPYSTRQTLIAKIMDRHNDQSWDEFIDFYKAYIYSILIRMNVPPSEREDLAQKALLDIWKGIPKFEYRPGQSKFRNWVYTVTKYQATGYFRKLKSEQKKIDKASLTQTADDNTQQKLEEEEWKQHLFHLAWDRIKSELSDTYIQCFELLGSGNTIDDICQKLDIKKNTVHVYRQRILKRLGREIRFLDDELA